MAGNYRGTTGWGTDGVNGAVVTRTVGDGRCRRAAPTSAPPMADSNPRNSPTSRDDRCDRLAFQVLGLWELFAKSLVDRLRCRSSPV